MINECASCPKNIREKKLCKKRDYPRSYAKLKYKDENRNCVEKKELLKMSVGQIKEVPKKEVKKESFVKKDKTDIPTSVKTTNTSKLVKTKNITKKLSRLIAVIFVILITLPVLQTTLKIDITSGIENGSIYYNLLLILFGVIACKIVF